MPGARYCAVQPPSMTSSLPVTNEDSSEARWAPDIFLGWGEQDGFHFYVRQLRDMKGSIDFVPGETDIDYLIERRGLCGWALALAHAKSGNTAMITGYAGKGEVLDEAIARFASACADQTERDYDVVAKAARARRIRVACER